MDGDRFDGALHAAASAIYVVAGVVVIGRALNSQAVMNWRGIPVVGQVTDALRAVWNQVYDVSGAD